MAVTDYITDGVDFSTVNASTNHTVTLPNGSQEAIDFYGSSLVVNTWKRFHKGASGVIEAGGFLNINPNTGQSQQGLIQKLSNLTVGVNYIIAIDIEIIINSTNAFGISIYSGTILQQILPIPKTAYSGGFVYITFNAFSTNDTIVIVGDSSISQLIIIDSISVTEETPSGTFLTGLAVKPLSVSGLGNVTFTSGNDDNGNAILLNPNQMQCEAYGYTYNQVTGTCSAYRFNTNLNRAVANENNKSLGKGNSTETGTNNTLLIGENNTVKGFSRNSIISGSKNEIANGINNANVSGFLGEATASNSIVLGGNSNGDILGQRQFIRCIYAAQTTSNSSVSSSLNNETGVRFVIPDNTIIYFHAETVVVRTGGSNAAGAVGDYGSYVERGVIINKSGTTTIQRERDTIKTSGTVTNWRILAETGGAAGAILKLSCRGQTNMILEWCMNVSITQIKTGVTL